MKNSQEHPNIYCLTSKDGNIPIDTRQLIDKNLCNDLARKNLNRAIEIGRQGIDKNHIYILNYGQVNIWFVAAWTSAKYTSFKNVTFLNHL